MSAVFSVPDAMPVPALRVVCAPWSPQTPVPESGWPLSIAWVVALLLSTVAIALVWGMTSNTVVKKAVPHVMKVVLMKDMPPPPEPVLQKAVRNEPPPKPKPKVAPPVVKPERPQPVAPARPIPRAAPTVPSPTPPDAAPSDTEPKAAEPSPIVATAPPSTPSEAPVVRTEPTTSQAIGVVCPSQVKPKMPLLAAQEGITGVVRARVLVREGRVAEVTILSGPKVFHAEVKAAMLAYRCDFFEQDAITEQRFVFEAG